VRRGIVRSVIWWIYYGLFLGLCIFILIAVTRYGIRFVFAGEGKLSGAHILYGVAVGIMIFGLLSMSIAYLARNIWHRIKGQTDFQKTGHHPTSRDIESRNLASERVNGPKSERKNHS
jgi:NhaP-type Na+/H+ or K+/H+ antiporter